MACNIEQANNDIDRLLESSISEDIKKELRVVKEQLTSAKKLKLEENKDNKSSESKTDDIRKYEFRREYDSFILGEDITYYRVIKVVSKPEFDKNNRRNISVYNKIMQALLSDLSFGNSKKDIENTFGKYTEVYTNEIKKLVDKKYNSDIETKKAKTLEEWKEFAYKQEKIRKEILDNIEETAKKYGTASLKRDELETYRFSVGVQFVKDTKINSVQQVLEQYKKDENIEKENAKLLKYIQDNVKFEMNYSKQLAYDFFIKESVTGNYDWKDNVVTIADFDGLRNDKEMMKMLSIEQVNQDDSVKDIDTASTQINMIISEINKRNIKFTTKLHESVHAAVFNYMRGDKGKAYSEEMTKLYEVVKQAAEANPDMFTANRSYWSKDVDEFLAEALSKPELIKDLMKIDIEGNLITGAKKSMFDKIIDMIVEALGLYTKEDKLNMHKYLLDSFKAVVEANRYGKEYISNKAPDRDVKLDKKRYENMSLSELKSELEDERYPVEFINNLRKEINELEDKDNQTDEEFNRLLEIESILELGLYNEITEYISSVIKAKENESKNNDENINKNINKIYNNIEKLVDKVGDVDVEIVKDEDKIIELLNRYNKNINAGGFYNNSTSSITVFNYKGFNKNDIKYINSKLNNKIVDNNIDEIIDDFIERRSSDNFIKQNIVHEKIHFATVDFMNKNPDNKYVKDISRIFEIAKSSSVMKKIKNDYWSTNEKEFIAEALSNPDVINGLMSIKSNNTNLLNKLVVAIGRILGIEPESNLYNDMLEIFENIANDETNKLSSFKIKIEFNKNKYKTINEEDIMQAKDIMLKNKEECR